MTGTPKKVATFTTGVFLVVAFAGCVSTPDSGGDPVRVSSDFLSESLDEHELEHPAHLPHMMQWESESEASSYLAVQLRANPDAEASFIFTWATETGAVPALWFNPQVIMQRFADRPAYVTGATEGRDGCTESDYSIAECERIGGQAASSQSLLVNLRSAEVWAILPTYGVDRAKLRVSVAMDHPFSLVGIKEGHVTISVAEGTVDRATQTWTHTVSAKADGFVAPFLFRGDNRVPWRIEGPEAPLTWTPSGFDFEIETSDLVSMVAPRAWLTQGQWTIYVSNPHEEDEKPVSLFVGYLEALPTNLGTPS